MTGYEMRISFKSELFRVEAVMSEIMSFIKSTLPYLKSDAVSDLRLIFHELLCNAVLHGNRDDENKSVHLFVEVSGGCVCSVISDEGPGFDYIKLLSKIEDEDNLMDENGRGIRLVQSLADSLTFNPNGNQIEFNKRVADNG